MGTSNAAIGLFKAATARPETKADTTTRTVREMLNAEADKRDAKTARLREARLAAEAARAEAEPAPAAKKAAAKRTRKAATTR